MKTTENFAQALAKKFQQMQNDRRRLEPTWAILSALCLPNRNGKFKNSSPASRHHTTHYLDDIYDSTGAQSADYLTATLMGGLATKTLKWFHLIPNEFSQNTTVTAQELELDLRTNFMLKYLANPKSGFYTALAEATMETVVLGTGILECYYEPAEGIKYRAISLESCYITTDYHGQVDTVFRYYAMTARQLLQQWGENKDFPKEFKYKCEQNLYEPVEVIRAVIPNSEYDEGKTDKYKFKSVYFLKDFDYILEETLLDYFPFVVPRWSKDADEDYGYSPARTCQADMETIQAMSMSNLQARQMAQNPMQLATDDGSFTIDSIQPGNIIFGALDAITGKPKLTPQITGINPTVLDPELEQRREAVRRTFFNNQLIQQNRPQMTAEEVSTLREENLRALSPSVLRYIDEVLYPLIVKTYHLLNKHKLFPPTISENATAMFKDYEVDVEFDSPLANTTKMADFQAFSRYFQTFLLPMAQTDPTIVDTLNMSRAAYMNAHNLGVPLQILNTPEEAAAIKQGRQQAQQSQFQLQAQDIQSKAMLEQQKINAVNNLKANEDGVL